jgi:hypothetical protein
MSRCPMNTETGAMTVFYEQFHHAADTDLFVVGEGLEPAGELVGALNLPRHVLDYAIDGIMRLGLYSAVRVPQNRPFLESCK